MTPETPAGNDFNAYQYQDLLARSRDQYAHTKYRILLEWLGAERKPLRILNAGCGSGDLSFLLAGAGHEILGIDPSRAYVELARQTAAATEDIKGRIAAIQGSTASAVTDINQISTVIRDVSDIVGTIATAIEEQAMVTRDIAGNLAKARAAAPKAAKGGEARAAGPGEYVVKPGDNGMKIVKATGVSLNELETLNPGIDWKHLRIGQTVKTK